VYIYIEREREACLLEENGEGEEEEECMLEENA